MTGRNKLCVSLWPEYERQRGLSDFHDTQPGNVCARGSMGALQVVWADMMKEYRILRQFQK